MARIALVLIAFASCLMSARAEAETIIYHATSQRRGGSAADKVRGHRNRNGDDPHGF